MSARERNLLILAALVGVIYLEAAAMLGGLLMGGRRAALMWTLYGAMLVVALFIIWALGLCIVPERWYYAVRDNWHRRCCMWWNIPYVPLPLIPATTHPTDKMIGRHTPVVRGDLVVVRAMGMDAFHALVDQHQLRPCVPGEE